MTGKHGWTVENEAGLAEAITREFILEPVSAVPVSVAERTGTCRIRVFERLDDDAASRWTVKPGGVDIELAAEEVEPHDLGMELLLCLGQILWHLDAGDTRTGYLRLLDAEIRGNVTGEIYDDVLAQKGELLGSVAAARSPAKLESYAGASFAATFAEYVHAFWHDVSIRTAPEHLQPPALRKRLEFMAEKYPPDAGQQLFG